MGCEWGEITNDQGLRTRALRQSEAQIMLASTCAGSKAGVVRRTSTAGRPDDESSDVAVKTASMTSVASIAPPPNHQASTLHGLQQVGHDTLHGLQHVGHDVGRSMHNLLHPVDSLLDDDWEDHPPPSLGESNHPAEKCKRDPMTGPACPRRRALP